MRVSSRAAIALLAVLATGMARAAEGNRPGVFDYYVLVLSWTPTYCHEKGHSRKDSQCERTHHSFTVHGLWPQYEEGWPLNCPIGKYPWVPKRVIDEILDIMPSKRLVIHEYRTHGTCSGLKPAEYYAVTRELYEQIKMPPRFASFESAVRLTPEEIEREFVEVNPWLKPDMMAVACRGGKLLDLRFCFGRDLIPRACSANEAQARLCRPGKIDVPQGKQR